MAHCVTSRISLLNACTDVGVSVTAVRPVNINNITPKFEHT